jgi:hypothetical protein
MKEEREGITISIPRPLSGSIQQALGTRAFTPVERSPDMAASALAQAACSFLHLRQSAPSVDLKPRKERKQFP